MNQEIYWPVDVSWWKSKIWIWLCQQFKVNCNALFTIHCHHVFHNCFGWRFTLYSWCTYCFIEVECSSNHKKLPQIALNQFNNRKQQLDFNRSMPQKQIWSWTATWIAVDVTEIGQEYTSIPNLFGCSSEDKMCTRAAFIESVENFYHCKDNLPWYLKIYLLPRVSPLPVPRGNKVVWK